MMPVSVLQALVEGVQRDHDMEPLTFETISNFLTQLGRLRVVEGMAVLEPLRWLSRIGCELLHPLKGYMEARLEHKGVPLLNEDVVASVVSSCLASDSDGSADDSDVTRVVLQVLQETGMCVGVNNEDTGMCVGVNNNVLFFPGLLAPLDDTSADKLGKELDKSQSPSILLGRRFTDAQGRSELLDPLFSKMLLALVNCPAATLGRLISHVIR